MPFWLWPVSEPIASIGVPRAANSSVMLRALYPRSADFQDLLGRYDPDGKFRNGFLSKYFPAGH